MKQEQQSLISRLKEQRSVRKHLTIAVCLIAILTAFAVFWSLRISGLTLEEETATGTDATGTDATTGTNETTSGEPESGTENNNGISLALEEGITLTSSASLANVGATSSDYYYFADKVSASEALTGLGDYVLYTEINDTYYLVDGNGSLAELSNLAGSSDNCLSWYSDGEIDNYKWELSESSSVNYLYNSSYGHYLSPSTTKTVTGTSNSSGIYETLATIEDGQSVAVTVSGATASVSSGYGLFYMRVYNESTGNYFYIRTAFGNNPVGRTGGTLSYTVSDDTSNFGAGLTYVVIISRSSYDYTITVYDETNDNVKMVATLTGSAIGDDALIQFSAGRCTYDLTVDVLDSYSTSAVYTTSTDAVTVDNSSEGISIAGFQSTTADTKSLSGSFEITYSFKNTGNYGATDGYVYNWRNYVIKLMDSKGYSVYVRADAYAWIHTDADYINGSTTSAVWDSGKEFSWDEWRSMMNDGVDMTVNIVWDNDSKTLKVVASGGGATITTTFDLSSYGFASDGKVTLYLTGEYCNLSNITRTDNSIYNRDSLTYTISDSLYLMNYSTTAQGITITPAAGSAWTGAYTNSNNTVWNLFAELNSINAVEWITSDGTALTNSETSAYYDSGSGSLTINSSEGTFQLYFAKIREFTAYFDGTNGGVYSSYRHSSYTANIQVTVQSAEMDSEGKNFYVAIPTVALTDTESDGTTVTNERANVTLAGWLDIYNATYYSLGSTVTVPYDVSTDLTVCYADWVATNYNGGSADDTYYDSDGLETSGFITTNVFDYNDLFNTYSEYLSAKATSASSYVFGGSSETWLAAYTINANTVINNLFSSTGWGFMFIKAGGSALLNTSDRNSVETDGGTDINANNDDGATTGILSSTSTSAANLLEQLFGVTTSLYGKKYLGTGNYLYQHDDVSGYYYFDSDLNAAFYNQSDSRFYLYDYKVALDDASSNGDFFPFSYDETQSTGVSSGGTIRLSASNIDYYFGMSSEITFYLPQDTGTYENGSYGNQTVYDDYSNMVFKFSGDDDVWVVLDYGETAQQLLLDIGGVHGQVYGEIDFSTGTVRVVNNPAATFTYTDANNVLQTETIVTYDENGIIGINENYTGTELVTTTSLSTIKSGSHTLTVFYMERGASQSNAAIYFNISPVYSVKMTKVGNDASTSLEGVTFNLYKNSSFTEENYVTTVTTDQYGALKINALVPQTTYYLVETSAASGYPLTSKYVTIYVDTRGNATLTLYTRDGTEVESLACDVASSTTAPSENRYLIQTLSSTRTSNETYGNYIEIAFTYANYLEYELPSTGNIGITPYIQAGTLLVIAAGLGLVIVAFYGLVRARWCRAAKYKEEGTKEKGGRKRSCAGTRDRPWKRGMGQGHARGHPQDR